MWVSSKIYFVIYQFHFLPESDLYSLIIRSKLPAAEQFEELIMGEVLPTIRKAGLGNPSAGDMSIHPPAQASRSTQQQASSMRYRSKATFVATY